MSNVFTADQIYELETRGHTKLSGFVDSEGVELMQAAVWNFLDSRGVRPGQNSEWPDQVDKLQPLRKAGAFDPFLTPELDMICDSLIGPETLTNLGTSPQALISLPETGPWVIPHKVWHFDLPPRGPTHGAIGYTTAESFF